MKAVVLAAGKGERLWPLTETRPKPLLPVANTPILEGTLSGLVEAGVRDIVLVVSYKEDMIRESLGDGSRLGCHVEYVKQKSPRGTADAVRSAKDKLVGEDGFLVVYGDDYYATDVFMQFVARAKKNNSITLATCKVDDPSPFGTIEVKNGRVMEIREKMARSGPGLVNAGIYSMNGTIFASVKKTARSERGEFELTDSLRILTRQGEVVRSEELGESAWLGISYPWDLLEANERVLRSQENRLAGQIEDGVVIRGNVVLDEGSVLKAGSRLEGPVRAGKGCQIGPNAYLRAYTCLGEDVKVGAACEIKNSIVMAGSKIPHLSYVGDSVIGVDCSLGAGTITANLRFDEAIVRSRVKGMSVSSRKKKLGAILGDEVRTGINVSIFPGVKVGSGAWLGPGAVVERDVASDGRIRAA